MNTEPNKQIFMDKIKLAATLIAKEMNMIHMVNALRNQVKNGSVDISAITYCQEWDWAWQNISEIYDFLKFEYLEKLEEKYSKVINDIMKKYNQLDQFMTYEEMVEASDVILRMMAISGFHNVSLNTKNSPGLLEPTSTW